MADLEILYAKTVGSPIHVKESEELKLKLSAVKVYFIFFLMLTSAPKIPYDTKDVEFCSKFQPPICHVYLLTLF